MPEKDPGASLFTVQPIRSARKECAVGKGKLFERPEELRWVLDQLRLLRHWPPVLYEQEPFAQDLDFGRISYRKVEFYELRLSDGRLHKKNLRVFFWIDDSNRTVWIIHGYWKKTQKIPDEVKCLVARRIRNLKGAIQDGSVL